MDGKLQRKWVVMGRLGAGQVLTSGPRPKTTSDRQFPWPPLCLPGMLTCLSAHLKETHGLGGGSMEQGEH